jgi:hypothetical protein
MLVSRRGVRLTGYSEIGRKVRYEHRAAAEAQLAMKLGVAQVEGIEEGEQVVQE